VGGVLPLGPEPGEDLLPLLGERLMLSLLESRQAGVAVGTVLVGECLPAVLAPIPGDSDPWLSLPRILVSPLPLLGGAPRLLREGSGDANHL